MNFIYKKILNVKLATYCKIILLFPPQYLQLHKLSKILASALKPKNVDVGSSRYLCDYEQCPDIFTWYLLVISDIQLPNVNILIRAN